MSPDIEHILALVNDQSEYLAATVSAAELEKWREGVRASVVRLSLQDIMYDADLVKREIFKSFAEGLELCLDEEYGVFLHSETQNAFKSWSAALTFAHTLDKSVNNRMALTAATVSYGRRFELTDLRRRVIELELENARLSGAEPSSTAVLPPSTAYRIRESEAGKYGGWRYFTGGIPEPKMNVETEALYNAVSVLTIVQNATRRKSE